ncbi:hypothetical protein EJ06DRAFT_395494 [Trichodelitschia bisporula]|uniref:Uncharacterized protein n=1 Tax=Trichodelitschia bisporula TaxID=703511 RepID=A0A6G1I0D4_9PEZI|nr:hypothetical protein EJ06DRAFT_395494 [Trichodelitschia bisporula]
MRDIYHAESNFLRRSSSWQLAVWARGRKLAAVWYVSDVGQADDDIDLPRPVTTHKSRLPAADCALCPAPATPTPQLTSRPQRCPSSAPQQPTQPQPRRRARPTPDSAPPSKPSVTRFAEGVRRPASVVMRGCFSARLHRDDESLAPGGTRGWRLGYVHGARRLCAAIYRRRRLWTTPVMYRYIARPVARTLTGLPCARGSARRSHRVATRAPYLAE